MAAESSSVCALGSESGEPEQAAAAKRALVVENASAVRRRNLITVGFSPTAPQANLRPRQWTEIHREFYACGSTRCPVYGRGPPFFGELASVHRQRDYRGPNAIARRAPPPVLGQATCALLQRRSPSPVSSNATRRLHAPSNHKPAGASPPCRRSLGPMRRAGIQDQDRHQVQAGASPASRSTQRSQVRNRVATPK
jgi:hypothetical protein